MAETMRLPHHVEKLRARVLESRAAISPADLRRDVYGYVAALVRGTPPAAALSPALEPYIRKVALNAYKVVDRDVDVMRAAGLSVDDIFEVTVVAAVSAGVARLEVALDALEEAAVAPAD